MINARLIAILFIAACFLSACLGPVKSLYPPDIGTQIKYVYVISHGWHTGIAIRTRDISRGIWPQSQEFAAVEYIEAGWGDWDYYQAPKATSGLTLKAALLPTRSVIHLVGFNNPPSEYFSESTVIEIALSEKGFARLSEFIAGEYSDAASINDTAPRQDLYPISRFYPARGVFHVFNNCNTWVARALRSAGYPITPFYAITSGNVVNQAKTLGITVEFWDKNR